METFSLLKYWRSGGGGGGGSAASAVSSSPSTTTTTTISTTVLSPTVSSVSDSDEEGSFFDLEFAVQEEAELATSVLSSTCEGGDDDNGEVIGGSEPNSPSGGDMWGNSIVISADPDGTRALPQFPVSLLKSATKIRVFLLGLKKPRSSPAAADQTAVPSSAVVSPKSKFLVVSLFSRDSKQSKSCKEDAATVSAEERKFAKEVVLKYLNKIRPLYVRVSKRYGEKLRFATSEGEETDAETEIVLPPQASATPAKDPPPSPPVVEPVHVVACGVRAPRASVPAGLKEVCKRLGKSRSASAAVVVKAAATEAAVPPQRRDDSLIQQQDGIQSAIAHCKRSFNSSSCSSSSSSSSSIGSESPLQRSMSDPGDGRLEIPAAEKSA